MTYLTELADKVVESVEPYQAYDGALADKVSVVQFTDGSTLTVYIDSRNFFFGGAEVRTDDLDAITTDCFFVGGVIRTPEPPCFRMPSDPVLREIVTSFKDLQTNLMSYYGSHHANPNERFEEVVRPWRETVHRYSGYRRGNNLTSPLSVSIQTNERRAQWSTILSNSRAMRKLATMLQSLSSGSRRKVRRA